METTRIALDMFQTAGVGVLALLLGMFITRMVPFLKKMCIPAPVTGGIIFSLITLVCYTMAGVEFTFDGTLKDICMMIFFTSVGFQSNLTVLKQGGKPLVMLVLMMVIVIIFQNLLSVGIASGMGLNPLIGMAAGSIPMSGGHGTAGGFISLWESRGIPEAASISMAAATFGLIAGSLIGGPVAESLIRRHKLSEKGDMGENLMAGMEANTASPEAKTPYSHSENDDYHVTTMAVYQILIALALGTALSWILKQTGITFPTYFGTLLVAAVMRNCSEMIPSVPKLKLDKIISIGNICLSLFLGMAMISLRLWELAGLALPLILMLLGQALLMALMAYFVAFPLLGKNYDAAVLVSGVCGFGLGATPNAMANMSAVCFKYRYSVNPFVIVPIVGAMFVDLINTTVVTIFLNLL